MEKLIGFFSDKHILVNFIVIAVIVGAVIFWNITGKEDLPNIAFDRVLISASFPGATAEEVERFVTREIEASIEGLEGIISHTSTSGQGSSTVFLELDKYSPNRGTVVSEITDAVVNARLPEDVDPPRVREFKSSRRAIIDIALYYENISVLSVPEREALQRRADALVDRLKRLSSVSEVGANGLVEEYIEIGADPEKLAAYNIALSDLITVIRRNNVNVPIGTLKDEAETKLKLVAGLVDTKQLENVVVRGSFEGNRVLVSDLADVRKSFRDSKRMLKVNGREGIILTVTKTATAGIIEAADEIGKTAKDFGSTALVGSGIKLVLLDDESTNVRNRLSLILSNGLFGFMLILFCLFIFLNAKSGLLTAFGIPFSICVTMIGAALLGNTINNMTLAAVIIVLGMVVDDGIVVTDAISRYRSRGLSLKDAIIRGTTDVYKPITAAILSTCVAFVPLFFFQGRFGVLVSFLPPVIMLMLGASLFEALFVLPAHMNTRLPWPSKRIVAAADKAHWFEGVEDVFGKILGGILRFKFLVYALLIGLLVYSGFVFFGSMKFTMFPSEETTEVFITGAMKPGTLRLETEKAVRKIEEVIARNTGEEVVGYVTNIARSRRGAEARENEFSISVELVPRDKRKKASKEIIAEWQAEFDALSGFTELQFARSRFGQSSGSAIDVVIQETNNNTRKALAEELASLMRWIPSIANAQVEEEPENPQFALTVDKPLASRLGISPETVALSLRTILEGTILFTILGEDDEEIDVLLTVSESRKKDIPSMMELPIPNNAGYLVPLKTILSSKRVDAPNTVTKLEGKRVLHVYADLAREASVKPVSAEARTSAVEPKPQEHSIREKEREQKSAFEPADDLHEDSGPGTKDSVKVTGLSQNMTPLEIAAYLEKEIFPGLAKKYPTAEISFGGEIADSREAGSDFLIAVVFVILLIYVILALTLNSIQRPLIIMLSIPFGAIGIILALGAHGMTVFGFFSVIGALGLCGVVVNDAIVLLAKLESEYDKPENGSTPRQRVANVAKTRLRAVFLTSLTTVAGLMPTAYGLFGYDSMLAEMMLTMSWGLVFGTIITLILIPSLYCTMKEVSLFFRKDKSAA